MPHEVRTACPLNCYDTCALLVTVSGGRAVAVRGDPDHPVTRGFVCPKAGYQLARQYGPSRLLHPQRRTAGGWQRLSWDDAVDLLAEKLVGGNPGRSGTVLHYHDYGSSGHLRGLWRVFFEKLGAVAATGSLCWAGGLAAQRYDFGYHLAHDPADLVHSSLIVLWGRNPAHTNCHLIPFLRSGNARVVLIDPTASPSAALADLHLQPRPGTDGALALALAGEAVRQGRADYDFLARYTLGYEEFTAACREWTPERAEQVTGVPAAAIADLAAAYTAGPAAILLGYGVQRYQNGGATVRCIDGLAAVAGQVGRPGGGVSYANGHAALTLASLGGGEPGPLHPGLPRAVLAEALQSPVGRPVQVMVVTGGNPVNQVGDAARTRRALAAIPYKVVVDLRWSETALEADLLLPAATWLEQDDLYASTWHNYLTYGQAAVAPVAEARSELWMVCQLAKRLGLPGEWEAEPDGFVRRALAPLDLAEGVAPGTWFRHPTAPIVAWSGGRFFTPSGKFEFVSGRAVSEGGPAMASYTAPGEAATGSSWAAQYPLVLVSPRHRDHTHSQFYHAVADGDGLPAVRVHPDLLARLRIMPGDRVRVSSPRGTMLGRAQPAPGQRPEVVVVYEGGSVLAGVGVNLLTPQLLTDLGLGAAYYECRCRVDRDADAVAAGDSGG